MIRVFTLRLYEHHLDKSPSPGALPAGVTIDIWGARAAEGNQAVTRWHPEAAQRFAEGQFCAVAQAGTDVVAYCWLTGAPVAVAEINRVLIPGPDEVYLYEAYTSPAWRGRGLFQALLLRLQQYAHDQGRRRALIFVLASNVPSWRAIERAGFEMFQAVTKIEVLGLGYAWFRGSRSGRARVTLVPAR
jgi:RimJ/RimL family protein N-acetyltransferase